MQSEKFGFLDTRISNVPVDVEFHVSVGHRPSVVVWPLDGACNDGTTLTGAGVRVGVKVGRLGFENDLPDDHAPPFARTRQWYVPVLARIHASAPLPDGR